MREAIMTENYLYIVWAVCDTRGVIAAITHSTMFGSCCCTEVFGWKAMAVSLSWRLVRQKSWLREELPNGSVFLWGVKFSESSGKNHGYVKSSGFSLRCNIQWKFRKKLWLRKELPNDSVYLWTVILLFSENWGKNHGYVKSSRIVQFFFEV